jgi:monofunctional biosynthetic peptidoglycan transglycosylase
MAGSYTAGLRGDKGAGTSTSVVRWIGRATLAVVGGVVALVVLYRVLDPPLTPLMLRYAASDGVKKEWVDLQDISPALVRSVIAAEDARFFEHHGVDWQAIDRAREYNARHGNQPRRGGSTITMQSARNVFLWPGKSYVRKGLEVALAYLIELLWGKRRILEVYLNVIEWGPGVYGIEAASRTNFGVPASALDPQRAALLAAVLPNPRRWSPSRPTGYLTSRARQIERRAAHVRLETARNATR